MPRKTPTSATKVFRKRSFTILQRRRLERSVSLRRPFETRLLRQDSGYSTLAIPLPMPGSAIDGRVEIVPRTGSSRRVVADAHELASPDATSTARVIKGARSHVSARATPFYEPEAGTTARARSSEQNMGASSLSTPRWARGTRSNHYQQSQHGLHFSNSAQVESQSRLFSLQAMLKSC